MNQVSMNVKWEEHFISEAVELEEKMSSFDIESLSKSKIRLSLENNILSWDKYESWALQSYHCSSLKSNVQENILKNFAVNAQQAFDIYSNYDFWNEDLLPVLIWDNHLIVLGLQYNENLVKIENHIFILAKPEVLSYFSKLLFKSQNTEDELEKLERSYSQTVSRIEGLEIDAAPPPLDLNFTDIKFDATATNFKNIKRVAEPIQDIAEATNIWDFISERHDEYCFEAKKQFTAYVVLKVNDGKTEVFKMDPDLEKEQINEKLFEYKLTDQNPFAKVHDSGVSESFNANQLNLNLLNFKYVCITALKRDNKVVGFLVGFKSGNLSENDQVLLEDLAKEAA